MKNPCFLINFFVFSAISVLRLSAKRKNDRLDNFGMIEIARMRQSEILGNS